MGSDDPPLATEEKLCRNALISGIPAAFGMCSQLEGEGGAGGGEGEGATADVSVGTDAAVDAREDACEGEGEEKGAGAGAGAGGPVLVVVGDGRRGGEVSIARSSGRESMGTRAMRVRACRRGCCGEERMNRDRDGSTRSESGKEGCAANDLNVGARSLGERREEPVLGVGGGLDWVYA